MREIKFRYVLRDIKTESIASMIFTLEVIENNDIEWIYEQFEHRYGCDGNCVSESVNHCECGTIFDDYEIISRDQYTGRQDKNGIDIYGKDICIFEHNIKKLCGVGTVFWAELGCYWAARKKLPFLLHTALSVEVIGNIHENPEYKT